MDCRSNCQHSSTWSAAMKCTPMNSGWVTWCRSYPVWISAKTGSAGQVSLGGRGCGTRQPQFQALVRGIGDEQAVQRGTAGPGEPGDEDRAVEGTVGVVGVLRPTPPH